MGKPYAIRDEAENLYGMKQEAYEEEEKGREKQMSDTKVTYHACQGWGCHEQCIVECHTKDGKLVRTQRAIVPGVPNKNQICMKGVLSSKIPYAENRLTHPLKRVGERGEGKFERISWDQALDEIAAKLQEVIDKYGSRAIVTNHFPCGYPGSYGALQNDLTVRWTFTMDSSALESEAVDLPAFGTTVDMGEFTVTERGPIRQSENMIIIWGGNPLGYTRPACTTRDIIDAHERGVKLIHVSNMYDVTSAMCDEWVPVKSSTDAALALAMAHVIVEDGRVDTEFMIRETVAAYLVRSDTGMFLRESDVVDGGSAERFVVMGTNGDLSFIDRIVTQEAAHAGMGMSATENREVSKDDGSVKKQKEFSVLPELAFDGKANGIACKTAYALLLEHLDKYTPEYQESITGVPAQTCIDLARAYSDATPATIFTLLGNRYLNTIQTARAILLLTYLTGNLGKPGGSLVNHGNEHHSATLMNSAPVMFPPDFNPMNGYRVSIMEILDSMSDPDKQQYKAWLNVMGNPLLNWPNKALWRERILPNMDLVVSVEIRMTDTCKYSDYVLPEVTTFERYEVFSGQADQITLCEPAIEPVGEAKDAAWIWNGLATRLGHPDAFPYTNEEFAFMKAGAGNSCMQSPDGQPITVERLLKEKSCHLDLPMGGDWDRFTTEAWPTMTGRLEFYSETFVDLGEPMATLHPSIVSDSPLKEEYPLQFYIGRHKYFMQGQYTNIPENLNLTKNQFGVAINPAEAERRGMVDGETVEVFNQRGCMKTKLHLRNDIPVGMVHTWYSFDETWYPDTDSPQVLATPSNTHESATPLMRTLWGKLAGEMAAGGAPQQLIITPGKYCGEVILDVLCDIRKVG